ncbi:unnamed protein product [Peronospora belbahrii]|uniref:Uncharacterized protein n=1 Tax=Peronospora belbahrii TaxID=622444 RepID=A0AAU9KZU8_9STRA|nr:unnamed protein product [Peronospora belbahrii]
MTEKTKSEGMSGLDKFNLLDDGTTNHKENLILHFVPKIRDPLLLNVATGFWTRLNPTHESMTPSLPDCLIQYEIRCIDRETSWKVLRGVNTGSLQHPWSYFILLR